MPDAVKSHDSIEPWQLKQFSPVTGMALATASVAGVSWQTLQLVMYVGYVTLNVLPALNSYSPPGMLCELWTPWTMPTKLSGIQE